MGFIFQLGFVYFISLFSAMIYGESTHNTLIVVSMDGMSWEIVKNRTFANVSNILRVVDNGVSADNMKNVFPTKTWPNHVSLLTGLYPENHGIVSNQFWDPVFKERFVLEISCSNYDPKFYKDAEQVWLTYQKQGGKSAVYFWPGFSSYYIKPTYYEKEICTINCTANKTIFDENGWQCRPNFSEPFDQRVDKIIGWMKSPEPPKFIAFYMDEPDWKLHECGYCDLYKNAIELVDKKGIGYLLERLEQEKLLSTTNIVLSSDHGLVEVKERLYLEDYINPIPSNAVIVEESSLMHIWPADQQQLENIYNALKDKNELFHVYKKEEIPEEFHWKKNKRIPPLVIVAEKGVYIKQKRPPPDSIAGHGWSQKIPEMWSMFAAIGPDFKKKYKMKKDFKNIDLYPLFCHLLGIKPLHHDGNIDRVTEMLVNPPTTSSASKTSPYSGFLFVCIATIIKTIM